MNEIPRKVFPGVNKTTYAAVQKKGGDSFALVESNVGRLIIHDADEVNVVVQALQHLVEQGGLAGVQTLRVDLPPDTQAHLNACATAAATGVLPAHPDLPPAPPPVIETDPSNPMSWRFETLFNSGAIQRRLFNKLNQAGLLRIGDFAVGWTAARMDEQIKLNRPDKERLLNLLANFGIVIGE